MKKTELSKEAMQEHALAYEDAIEQIADALAIPLIDAMAYRPELSYALDAFAARAVEAEREACAAHIETGGDWCSYGAHSQGHCDCYEIAAAIRERGAK